MPIDTLLWIVLALTIGTVLTLDLLVFNRRPHAPTFREAAAFSAFYVGLGLAFGVLVFATRGVDDGSAYLAGYLLELSLSVDNVFVFALIFTAFAVPLQFQHRVLFYGILGAIVFRAIFIWLGTAIIEQFHAAIYVFGILLLVTGYRMWAQRDAHVIDPTRNPILRLFRRLVPTTDGYRGQRFIVHEAGRRLATPLLAVLVVVESSDILFAIDSVPAIFSVTTDPFLVFSSNAFAILGLRSLYFLLAGAVDRFRYLKAGLAALLVFAGLEDPPGRGGADPDLPVAGDHRGDPRGRHRRVVAGRPSGRHEGLASAHRNRPGGIIVPTVMSRIHPLRPLVLAVTLLVAACGAAATTPPSATPGGPVVTADDAVRAVITAEPRLAGIMPRDDELIGQSSWVEVAPASGVGAFIVAVRVGWGDCPAGCISEHTWQYAVAPNGTVTLMAEAGEPVPDDAWPAAGG